MTQGTVFAGNNFAQYPSFFKRLKDANGALQTVCLARWSPLLTVVPEADVKLAFGTDTAITDETCRRLTNSNPDVMYAILLDVDSAGHSSGWGPTVTNYVKEIEKADTRVGQMMTALKSRATYDREDWLVIVLSDHGQHDDPDPERSRITFHLVSGASAARGVIWPSPSIVDVCATVLTHMGVNIDPAWNLDARLEGFPLRPVHYGTNLLFNGDAEANSGTGIYATNRGVAWWFDIADTTLGVYGGNQAFPTSQTDIADTTLGVYGGNQAFPTSQTAGPTQRGNNFFLGGAKTGSISQRIELSEMATDIDASRISFTLSGWFGGAGAKEDSASLTLNLLDGKGAMLTTQRLGEVTAADRGYLTGMTEKSISGDVPPGTRFAEFVLATTTAQGSTSANDASADNLSFVLNARPEWPFSLLPLPSLPGKFSVTIPGASGRVYTLERSPNLNTWTQAAQLTVTGKPVVITDPAAPEGGAFYRVRSN
jgi:hypothetical protein